MWCQFNSGSNDMVKRFLVVFAISFTEVFKEVLHIDLNAWGCNVNYCSKNKISAFDQKVK